MDQFEHEIRGQIRVLKAEIAKMHSEINGLEKALAMYQRHRGAGDGNGPTDRVPPGGWKGLAKRVVGSSETPISASDVIERIRAMGYHSVNAQSVMSMLSTLARDGEIISDRGRYSAPLTALGEEGIEP